MKLKTFKEFISESAKTTMIPTKILGYNEDLLIHYINNKIEVFNSTGNHITLDKDSKLEFGYNNLVVLFGLNFIPYNEYKEEYKEEHEKYYKNNDWDSDYVVIKVNTDLTDLIKELKAKF